MRIASTSDDRTSVFSREGSRGCKADILTCVFAPVYTLGTQQGFECSLHTIPGPNAVSVVEDGTCCIWGNDGSNLATLRGHVLKNIWSVATDINASIILTGGGDSSIKVWDIARHASRALTAVKSTEGQLPQFGNYKQVDWLKLPLSSNRVNAIIVDEDCKNLFVATASGTCLHFHFDELCTDLTTSGNVIFDMSTLPGLTGESSHRDSLCCLSLSADGRWLLGGIPMGTVIYF